MSTRSCDVVFTRQFVCRHCGKAITMQCTVRRKYCLACNILRKAEAAKMRDNQIRLIRQGRDASTTLNLVNGCRTCKHEDWCKAHVLTGEALPCAPDSAIKDCRVDMTIDPLSRNKSYVDSGL